MKGILITVGLIVLLGGGFWIWTMNVKSSEIKLRTQIEGQQEMTQAFYTKLWEVLKFKAGVTDQYKEVFQKQQEDIMTGRKTDGEMMKWIQEANPSFDVSLYKDLMNSVQGERDGFFIEQKKLRDMKVSHDYMLANPWTKWILKGKEPIQVVILQNQASIKAYETGVEETINLFDKK